VHELPILLDILPGDGDNPSRREAGGRLR